MELQSTGLVFVLPRHAETNSSNRAGTAPAAVTASVDTQTEHERNHFLASSVDVPLIFVSISANLLHVPLIFVSISANLLHVGRFASAAALLPYW